MEIVLRAAVVFVFHWLITRAVGRATLGELSTFQLLLFLTMGDLAQQGVTQQDNSVTGAVLAVSTFAVLTAGFSFVNRQWPWARPVTHGSPIVIVRDGVPDLPAMTGEELSFADLAAAARDNGIRSFAEIQVAVLEATGQISFFTAKGAHNGAPAQPPVS